MKELTRPERPEILQHYIAGQDAWMDVDQGAIWPRLEEMQGEFCAYCECRLIRKHIEHFRPRDKFPAQAFDWHNLFGSCGDSSKSGGWKRCGIYKDNGAGSYNANDLIKPDEDNPDDFLLFLTSGMVVPVDGLTGSALKKAEETIRVFNLNGDSRLVGSRKTALKNVILQVEELYEAYDELGEDDWTKMLDMELENIEGEEFSTALKHAWRYNKKYV